MNKERFAQPTERNERLQKPGHNLEIIAGLIVEQKQDAQTNFERHSVHEMQEALDSLIYLNYLTQQLINEESTNTSTPRQAA